VSVEADDEKDALIKVKKILDKKEPWQKVGDAIVNQHLVIKGVMDWNDSPYLSIKILQAKTDEEADSYFPKTWDYERRIQWMKETFKYETYDGAKDPKDAYWEDLWALRTGKDLM
jgi:hypothetical protein